jgi:hypothetical protein
MGGLFIIVLVWAVVLGVNAPPLAHDVTRSRCCVAIVHSSVASMDVE